MNKNYPFLQIIFLCSVLFFSVSLFTERSTRTLNRWERTDTVKPTNWTETELLGFNYFNTLNWLTTFPRLSLLRVESLFPTMRTSSPTFISWWMLGWMRTLFSVITKRAINQREYTITWWAGTLWKWDSRASGLLHGLMVCISN